MRVYPQPSWVLTGDLELPLSLLERFPFFHPCVLTRGLTRARAHGRMGQKAGPFSSFWCGLYWELPSALGPPDSLALPPPRGTNAGSRPWLSHHSLAVQASL